MLDSMRLYLMLLRVDALTPIQEIVKLPKTDDAYSLPSMAIEAELFLLGQKWCKKILNGYLDIAWEGILGVFWFEIEPTIKDVDSTTWVIVGDLPSAYICNDNPNGVSALDAYVHEMQSWVDAVRAGQAVDDLITVNVSPTIEFADMLESRLRFIQGRLLAGHASEIDNRSVE